MAYLLTVLYHHPDDAEAFDRYYDEMHAPLAAKLPGLRSYTICRPDPGPDGQRPPYHLVALMTWDSAEAYQAGAGSDVGQAVRADVANFATGGVELTGGDSSAIV